MLDIKPPGAGDDLSMAIQEIEEKQRRGELTADEKAKILAIANLVRETAGAGARLRTAEASKSEWAIQFPTLAQVRIPKHLNQPASLFAHDRSSNLGAIVQSSDASVRSSAFQELHGYKGLEGKVSIEYFLGPMIDSRIADWEMYNENMIDVLMRHMYFLNFPSLIELLNTLHNSDHPKDVHRREILLDGIRKYGNSHFDKYMIPGENDQWYTVKEKIQALIRGLVFPVHSVISTDSTNQERGCLFMHIMLQPQFKRIYEELLRLEGEISEVQDSSYYYELGGRNYELNYSTLKEVLTRIVS